MSSKDSAGDKLVASIRQSKAAAAGSEKPAKKKAAPKPKPEPAKPLAESEQMPTIAAPEESGDKDKA